MKTRAIIVTGMHRSGTSLMASWLQASGVAMGQDLIGPTYGNPRGHFENRAFVDLQQSWIEANGLEFVLSADTRLKLRDSDLADARAMVEKHQVQSNWGWKDPRSVLFLETWHQLLPDSLVLIMIRPWRQVIHSLLRRDRRQGASAPKSWLVPLWHHPKNPLIIDGYVETCICYNRHARDFAQNHPGKVTVLSAEKLYKQRESIAERLKARGIAADPEILDGLFHPGDWEEDSRKLAVSDRVAAQAVELEAELKKLAL